MEINGIQIQELTTGNGIIVSNGLYEVIISKTGWVSVNLKGKLDDDTLMVYTCGKVVFEKVKPRKSRRKVAEFNIAEIGNGEQP